MSQLTQASVRYEVSVMLVDEVTSEETSAVEKVPYGKPAHTLHYCSSNNCVILILISH